MSEFQRETRYGVTKIKRLLPKQKDAFFQEFSELCAKHGTKSVACVVVEKGWPIYEEVWDMVQRFAEGREQKITELQRQNDELVATLTDISNMCIGELAMGYRIDAQSIGEAIFKATGKTNPELNDCVQQLRQQSTNGSDGDE